MNFHYEKLKSPEFFCENRLPAHSDHEAFACLEDLETGENRLRLCLNGPWKFFYALNEEQVVPGFEKLEYDCSAWADISVPAHIQMEGYGVPQYCNIQYPWDGSEDIVPGQIPERFNPVACYVKTFVLPESMLNMPVQAGLPGVSLVRGQLGRGSGFFPFQRPVQGCIPVRGTRRECRGSEKLRAPG